MTPGGKVVGSGNCRHCREPVWLKKNANGRLYYFCDGTGPEAKGMCNHHEKYGPIASRQLLAQIEPSNVPAATNQPNDKVDHGRPEPETVAPVAGAAIAADAGGKRRRGLIAGA